jgi:hypothetical protein
MFALMLALQIYMDINKIRRIGVLHLKSCQDLVAMGRQQQQPSAAAGGREDCCHSLDDPSLVAAGNAVAAAGHHNCDSTGGPLTTRALADPAVQAMLEKIFTLPDTPEAHMFVVSNGGASPDLPYAS